MLTDAGEYLSLPKKLISRWRNRGLNVPGAVRFRRWISGQSQQSPTVEVVPEDLAVIQFTGGTTGDAKGVMLSHRNLVAKLDTVRCCSYVCGAPYRVDRK